LTVAAFGYSESEYFSFRQYITNKQFFLNAVVGGLALKKRYPQAKYYKNVKI